MLTAERASRSVIWAGLEIASLLFLSLVTLVILARLLGPADFGLATLALVTVQFLTVLTRPIFVDALVQRERLEPGHFDAAFWAGLIMASLLTTLLVLVAPWVGRAFDEPILPAVFAWTAISLVFTGIDGVPMAILRRQLRMRELAIRSFLARLVAAIVGIGMAFAGYGVWSLVGQQIAIEVTYAVVSLWLTGWLPTSWRVSRRHLRDLAGFALPWLGGELLMTGTQRLFNLLVGYLFGTTALGYVNIGYRTVGTIGSALEVAAQQVSLPIFARMQGDLAALRRAFHTSTAIASFLVLPFFTGIAVCAEPVVLVLLGEEWRPAIPFVQLMALATFLHFLLSLAASVYSAVGRPIWRFWRGALDLAVTTVGLFALAGLGPIAAGVVWLARLLFLIPFSYYGVRRLIGLGMAAEIRGLAPSIAAAGAMAAAVLVVDRHLPAGWVAGQDLVLLIPLGVVVYFAVFAAIAWNELREYVGYGRNALVPDRGSGPPPPSGEAAVQGASANRQAPPARR